MSLKDGVCCRVGDLVTVPCPHSPTGMLRDRRMDSSNMLAEVDMVADSSIEQVVRLDVDDPLSKAARAASKRVAMQTVRTDEAREKALAKFDREMAQREWLERFHAGLVAQQNAERPPVDLEAVAQAAERRINEQWRPKS